MLFIWVLTSVLVVADVVASQRTVRASDDRPHTYCGRYLADAHLLYCYGTEAVATAHKKSLHFPLFEALSPYEEFEMLPARLELPSRYTKAAGALTLSSRGRGRNKRIHGLVDECCHKPCYISELTNYC